MKVFLLLGIVVLAMSAQMKEEPSVLATTSVSLLDLLEQVKSISSQLAEESFIEIPMDLSTDTSEEHTQQGKGDI